MTRGFRLTRRAENSLVDIALWTSRTFGPRQAALHESELIARCEEIARGHAASRSCAVLVDGAAELRYARAGEHFVVFLDRAEGVIVVDVLHARSDLPRHLAALAALDEGSG